MSTCPQCYTGTCKRHRGQDHGRSMVKSANAESTLQKMYEQLVGSKLQKLQAEAERDPSKQHTRDFRKQLDASRDKSMKKSRKSRSKLAKADVTGSGLNPQALAAIYGADSDDSDQEDEERRKRRKKHKHSSSSSRKRKHRSRSDSDSESDSDWGGYSSDDSRRRHKRSSRKHSHHKKSHKKKKHKRSRTDSE